METLKRILSENFICHVNNMYENMHKRTRRGAVPGGELRRFSGKTQEVVMYKLIRDICYTNGLKQGDFSLVKGDSQEHALAIKNGGGCVHIGVDWHLYVRGELVLINECKSYLDAAFMSRAHTYISSIKSRPEYANVKSVITSMERALDEDVFNYYMYDDTIDYCAFFTNGSRSSYKPIYKSENWKPIIKDSVYRLVSFIDNVVKENMKNNVRTERYI